MTKITSLIAVIAMVFVASCALAQDEGGNIHPGDTDDAGQSAVAGSGNAASTTTQSSPVWETREGQEKAARMVLSGELTIHEDGSTTVHKTTIVRRGGVSVRRASAMDKAIERRAKRYSNGIGTAALAKANAYTDKKLGQLRRELDAWKKGVSDVIAGVNTTARWALGIAILALLVAIRGNFFPRVRMPRTGDGY